MDPNGERPDQVWMLERLLSERWTCRQFRPDPVPRQTIEQLLGLAQRTPSWCNTQPWQVVVTEGRGTDLFRRALLHEARTAPVVPDFTYPTGYTDERRLRRRECGAQLYESVGIAADDRAATTRQALRNLELFDAPHVAVLSTPAELGTYGAVDCGLYVATFLLAAQALGLGAAPQAALAAYAPFLHSYFGLPDDRRVVVGISFGHAEESHPVNGFRTSRARLDDVVTWRTDGAERDDGQSGPVEWHG